MNFEEGKCLQILQPKQNKLWSAKKELELNGDNLENILYHPHVRDNPVMVISIAGAMREGKSFLLSLLVDYLENEQYSQSKSWLEDDSKEIPKHFKWRSGSKRETLGIYMWSKPYLIEMEDGTNVAVLLMDTQGLFDKDGNKDASNIIAFSTSLSSILMYNIRGNINENHMLPLNMFAKQAAEVLKFTDQSQKTFLKAPYQKLLFLIRDFQVNKDADIGIDGGKVYIDKFFKCSDNATPETLAVRQGIKAAFQEVSGCTLPYPGTVIAGHAKSTSAPKFKDLSDEFKSSVNELFRSILHPTEVLPKTIKEECLTGEDLFSFCIKYFSLLEEGGFDNPLTVMEATAVVDVLKKLTSSKKSYNEQMGKLLEEGGFMIEGELRENHERIKKKVMSEFDRKLSTNYMEVQKNYKCQTERELEEEFRLHEQTRRAQEATLRESYETLIWEILREHRAYLNTDHAITIDEAMIPYTETASPGKLYKEYEDKLRERIAFNYEEHQYVLAKAKELLYGEKLEPLIEEYSEKYKNQIVNEVNNKYIPLDDLERLHESYLKKILDEFAKEARKQVLSYDEILKLEAKLKEIITLSFDLMKKRNAESLEQLKFNFATHLQKTKSCYLKYMKSMTDNVYMKPEAHKLFHEDFLKILKKSHKDWVNMGATSRINDEFKQKEIDSLDQEFKELEREMQARKGVYTESYYRLKKLLSSPLVRIGVPLLTLTVSVACIVAPPIAAAAAAIPLILIVAKPLASYSANVLSKNLTTRTAEKELMDGLEIVNNYKPKGLQ